MTVAAVILAATPEGALADTLGQPRVRRLVDIAWSGGALPVVVVAADPEGSVAKALVGSEAVHEGPAAADRGPAGQMAHGADRARAEVLGTTAVLLWPARMTWVGPETVTSLIEAHGTDSATILRPAWQGDPGWPVLVPTIHLDALRAVAPELMPQDVIAALAQQVPSRIIEAGDPGVVHDVETPVADLPPYEGPPDPPAGHTHEWGEDVAAEAGLPGPDGPIAR
jgi:CTP:molybdopterin cytidylyltransferase MocA